MRAERGGRSARRRSDDCDADGGAKFVDLTGLIVDPVMESVRRPQFSLDRGLGSFGILQSTLDRGFGTVRRPRSTHDCGIGTVRRPRSTLDCGIKAVKGPRSSILWEFEPAGRFAQ